MASTQAALLAGRLRDGEFITAPGVYDMISARIADQLGFSALYMTGSALLLHISACPTPALPLSPRWPTAQP